MADKKRALIIGAGAVGQVYGFHLQRVGCDVTFYVRDKYVAELRAGLRLHHLQRWPRPRTTSSEFRDFGVISSLAEVQDQHWDEVWLTVSSTALDGLAPVLAASRRAHAGATLVSLQPGADVREKLQWPEQQLVFGMIGFIAWQSPLKDARGPQPAEPGIAVYFPPPSPSRFIGPAALVRDIVARLRAGGCPARADQNTEQTSAQGGAVLMPVLIALEGAGWSFRELRRSELLPQAVRGAKEAATALQKQLGGRVPLSTKLLNATVLRVVSALAPWAMPFDIETYLKYHFTKLGDQTRMMVNTYERLGQTHAVPTPTLSALRQRVFGPR